MFRLRRHGKTRRQKSDDGVASAVVTNHVVEPFSAVAQRTHGENKRTLLRQGARRIRRRNRARRLLLMMILASLLAMMHWRLLADQMDSHHHHKETNGQQRWQQRESRRESSSSFDLQQHASPPCRKNLHQQQQPREHPHAGARDGCGNWGYIHDPTIVPRLYPALPYNPEPECQMPFGEGSEGFGGYKALQKIKVNSNTSNSTGNNNNNNKRGRIRLLCMVYSVDTPHNNAMIRAIAETWGRRCDGFLVGSNVTDPSMGTVDIPHLGPEAYGSMWQKVRSMWSYVHDNYLDDYDFFFICGDDTYVIVNNLRALLDKAQRGQLLKDPNWKPTRFRELEHWENTSFDERPLYLGGMVPIGPGRYMCAGGAGYVLNRQALKHLIQAFPHVQADRIDSREDLLVAASLRNQRIACSDTRDETGAWTFHHLDAQFQFDWTRVQMKAVWSPDFLKETRGIQSLLGLEGLSEESVSFHLTTYKNRTASPERIRRYHAILYGLCRR